MKLTNFGSVVKTYKKNFLIRKEKFIAERRVIQAKKRKDREDRIEAQKQVAPLFKLKGSQSKKFNFLRDIKKFLGFVLAGFILQNLKNIIPILQEIFKKIEDLVKGTKEFVEGVIGGLQTFFDGLDGAKQKMDDLLSPILNADLSKFVPFQDQLDKVLTGVLGIASIITNMTGGNKVGDGDTPIDEAGRGAASASARRAALQRAKKLKQQQQVLRQIKIQQARAAQIADVAVGQRRGKITKVPGRTTAMGQQVFAQQAMIRGQGTGATKPPAGARVLRGNILTNIENFDESIFDETRKNLKTKQFNKPQVKQAELVKKMRGFFNPKNYKFLLNSIKTLGAGVALDIFASWAMNKAFEITGYDTQSIIKRDVLKYLEFPKEKKEEYVKKLNDRLERELNHQKSPMYIAEKIIALGGQVPSDIKVQKLAGILSLIAAISTDPIFAQNISQADLPDYLGSDVDITLPIDKPSVQPLSSKIVMPPLPPTGTGSPRLAAAQQYGAARPGGRRHAGVDFDPADDKNSKFYSRFGGEVIYAQNAGGGYGNVVDIYNAKLGITERIAEGDRIHVKVGDIVKPGTLVQSGSTYTGVFHYEIRKGKAGHSGAFEGTVDPLKFLKEFEKTQYGDQASIKTSPSSLISSAGLNQSTTYSSAGMSVRREVNNIFVPIAA